MCFSTPDTPKTPVAAAPVVKQDIVGDTGTQQAKFNERARLAKGAS